MISKLLSLKAIVAFLLVFIIGLPLSLVAQTTQQSGNTIDAKATLEFDQTKKVKKNESLLPYQDYKGIEDLDQAKLTWVGENDREYRSMLPEREAERVGANATESVPSNDLCDNAIPISCGSSISGTTTGSTFDDAGFCGTSNTAGGVWYTFTATNPIATLSTCNNANYDTKISVYSGSCGALVCVGGQDDNFDAGCLNFTTKLTVVTTIGQQYWVLVHGFGQATGDFTLSIDCVNPVVPNDLCDGAIPISCGSTVSGTTTGSTFDNVGFCGTSNTTGGVWYSFEATSPSSVLSTCNSATYDTKISVFSGSCGALSCVGGQDDNFDAGCQNFTTELTVSTTPGETYYVLVHGFGQATGDFDLTLSNSCGFCAPVDGSVYATPGTPVSPGGMPNTLYIGYGPTSVDLTAQGTGGSGSYSYAWSSPNGTLSSTAGATVTATPIATETYTVTITDDNGCGSVTRDITITVVDVRCGNNNNKVLVCKVPPGNPGNAINICVSPSAVASHLATGSYLGACANKQILGATDAGLSLYPNPASGQLNIEFELTTKDNVHLQIYDSYGRLVSEERFVESAGLFVYQVDVSNLANGVYLIRMNGKSINSSSRFTICN